MSTKNTTKFIIIKEKSKKSINTILRYDYLYKKIVGPLLSVNCNRDYSEHPHPSIIVNKTHSLTLQSETNETILQSESVLELQEEKLIEAKTNNSKEKTEKKCRRC